MFAWQDGKMTKMRESEATHKGLTVIDLSNYWVPFIFSERNSDGEERIPNTYRSIFRKLANDWPYDPPSIAAAKKIWEEERERRRRAKMAALREEGKTEEEIRELLGDGAAEEEAPVAAAADPSVEADPEHSGAGDANHYLEVYGIPPSLSVLKRRSREELNRDCYKDIDLTAIRAFNGFIAYDSNDAADAAAKRGRSFAVKMRAEMERLGVTDAAILFDHPENRMSKKLIEIGIAWESLVEAQKALECEGLYEEGAQNYRRGGLDWKTHNALVAFERKNRIFGWGYYGKETLEALGRPAEARLMDAFMRVLAERVVDATGIIEDGTARDAEGNPVTYKDEQGNEHTVGNLVAEYTATAMRHMGLATPEQVAAFLSSFSDEAFDTLFVAVPLPPPPPYHSKEMELRAVIHRGDVWYEYPYTADFKPKGQSRKVMPTTTLYVKWNNQEFPIATMNTTIGSWRTELAPDGYEYYKYKNSDVGPRVWKDIVAGPVWLPPDTTPVGDLTKKVSYRHRLYEVPNYSEFGPGYASAYGLVAAFHERPVERRDGTVSYLDNGIRSHGSVDYNSILRRYSHGCHRLYNHLAIRLFDFVLRHKSFARVGQLPATFSKVIETEEGNTFEIRLDTRGYKYELRQPLPIVVETGNIKGSVKAPIEIYMPKPGEEYGPDAQFLPPEFAFLKNGLPDSESDSAPDSDSAKTGE